jgi:hypothetical protein
MEISPIRQQQRPFASLLLGNERQPSLGSSTEGRWKQGLDAGVNISGYTGDSEPAPQAVHALKLAVYRPARLC